jgi:hypothetical protein
MPDLPATLGPGDLPAAAPEITYCDVPEWGGRVGLCPPSSLRCDRVQIAASIQAGEAPAGDATAEARAAYRAGTMTNFHARTVALCLCDDAGTPWYEDPIAGGQQLGSRAGEVEVIQRLYETARLLCPHTREAVEILEKNSVAPEGSGSSGNCESAATSA